MPLTILALIVFSLFTIILVIFVFYKTTRTKKKFSSADLKFFHTQWKKIYDKSQEKPDLAILDADKLLYKALDIRGYKGSVGEKLMAKPFIGDTLNNTWYAHKTRNRIAHETDVTISNKEVKKVLKYFEVALKELGGL